MYIHILICILINILICSTSMLDFIHQKLTKEWIGLNVEKRNLMYPTCPHCNRGETASYHDGYHSRFCLACDVWLYGTCEVLTCTSWENRSDLPSDSFSYEQGSPFYFSI